MPDLNTRNLAAQTAKGSTALAPPRATTAELAAATNAINTKGKVLGKLVINTTTGKLVWATGATATSVWNDAAGAAAHTPA